MDEIIIWCVTSGSMATRCTCSIRNPRKLLNTIRSCWSAGVHKLCVSVQDLAGLCANVSEKKSIYIYIYTPGSFDTLGGPTCRTYNPKRNQLNSRRILPLPHIVAKRHRERAYVQGTARGTYWYIPTLGLNQHSSD